MKKLSLSILSVMLTLTVMMSLCATAFAQSRVLYLGDSNLDGSVNIKDATLIQKYSASIEEISDDALLCAEVTKDKRVNVKDATAIQKFVAGMDDPYG
ncbi:MAG: dockerin type I repeat-containing protein, partial [Eubacteriales bacterium]|nr:dockerin type I repeat-containing protein [Eubacteriales bacterium]